jgi:hypothetical protein
VLISRRFAQLVGAVVLVAIVLAVAARAEERRLPPGVFVQPHQRHVHAVDRHALPCIPCLRWSVPCRLELLADVAHVRRDGVSLGCGIINLPRPRRRRWT